MRAPIRLLLTLAVTRAPVGRSRPAEAPRMGAWIDEPIVDPTVPERDRRRLVNPALWFGRPDPEPPRWVRWLFGAGAAVTGVGGALFAAAAYHTDHESAGLAALMVFLITVLFTGVARPGPGLTRRYAGRYVVPAELDDAALDLLARARQAVMVVTSSRAHRLGLLDAIANEVVLPDRLWEIARLLRTHTELRSEQAQARAEEMTPELAAVLESQERVLGRSVAAVVEQVQALEVYAGRVRTADAALRAHDLRKSDDRYRDLLAQTADTEGLTQLIDQADTLTSTLRRTLE